MLLNAAFIPPDRIQDEIESLTLRVVSALGGLDEAATRPFLLPVTGFGNLTNPDATRALQLLGTALAEVEKVPVLRFSTLSVASDGAVRLGLSGDVDEFVQLARHVPTAVERLHLYVDRRQFWPGLVLGRTTAPDSALGELRAWSGTEWPVTHVSTLKRVRGELAPHAEVQVGVPARL